MDFDADTAFYHTWFREYDPGQGRWMAVDPLPGHEADPQTYNRYVYVRNDPVNLRDPLGLDVICWWVWGEDINSGIEVCINFLDGGLGGGGGDLLAIFEEKLGEGAGGGSGNEDKPCFAELRFAPVKHWLAGKVFHQTHAFWYVQDRNGDRWIVTAGPEGGAYGSSPRSTSPSAGQGSATLNVWTSSAFSTQNNVMAIDKSKTAWPSGPDSPDSHDCDKVDALLSEGDVFPNNQIPYSIDGPNSNTAARWLGSPFNPTRPPGALGWGTSVRSWPIYH
jgi:RHS repeat-associated protein